MVDVARTRRVQGRAREGSMAGETSLSAYAQGTIERVKQYARDEPIRFGLWAFGIGFLIGWRLKPW